MDYSYEFWICFLFQRKIIYLHLIQFGCTFRGDSDKLDFYCHQFIYIHRYTIWVSDSEEQCYLYVSPPVIICQLPPSRLGFPALRQRRVSLSGKFYLQLNSAPPPAVASSTGSALLSTKQTVNSRFMSWGGNISHTHSPKMFLHGAPNSDMRGFAAVLQLVSREGSGCWKPFFCFF